MNVSSRLRPNKDRKTSFRGLLRPSVVFSVRLDPDLVDDLGAICSITHINKNALISLFLGYCVSHVDDVLDECYQVHFDDSEGSDF